MKYNFVYPSQINHGVQKIFSVSWVDSPPPKKNNIKVESFIIALYVVQPHSCYLLQTKLGGQGQIVELIVVVYCNELTIKLHNLFNL